MDNYFKSCQYSNRLLEKLKLLDNKSRLDFDLINKAMYWAKKYHNGQFRKTGEPFYTHPFEVAYIISDYNLKTDVIVVSVLHDIVEDTEVTVRMIVDTFGWRIAEMVNPSWYETKLKCRQHKGYKGFKVSHRALQI